MTPKEPRQNAPMKISGRQANIIRRMAAGETFYFSGGSPRMTQREWQELHALGLPMQSAAGSAIGEGVGSFAYPMDAEGFIRKARKLGVIP